MLKFDSTRLSHAARQGSHGDGLKTRHQACTRATFGEYVTDSIDSGTAVDSPLYLSVCKIQQSKRGSLARTVQALRALARGALGESFSAHEHFHRKIAHFDHARYFSRSVRAARPLQWHAWPRCAADCVPPPRCQCPADE